jgi:Cys-rich four helix bundle protein (predicted Tat secretion target)
MEFRYFCLVWKGEGNQVNETKIRNGGFNMAHEQHQELIRALHDCAAECNHCFDACLQEDDVKMLAQCIRLDRECADMCAFLEHAITHNSPFVSELAAVCATICEACAEECEKHADHHEHCRRCAEACRRCAEACRNAA